MKIYSLAVVALSLAVAQGLQAEPVTVQTLDQKTLQEEIANPDQLADAQTLSDMLQAESFRKGHNNHGGHGHANHGGFHSDPGHHNVNHGHGGFSHPPHFPPGHGHHPVPPAPIPFPIPVPYPTPPPMMLTCFTRDGYGVVYRAQSLAMDAISLQQWSQQYCQTHSPLPMSCVNLGCRYTP